MKCTWHQVGEEIQAENHNSKQVDSKTMVECEQGTEDIPSEPFIDSKWTVREIMKVTVRRQTSKELGHAFPPEFGEHY